MSILRKHWLLILLIVVGLLWWHIYDLFTPTLFGFNPPLKDVDYWSLMNNPTLEAVALFGFIGVGILMLIQMRRVSEVVLRVILIVTTLLMFSFSTFISKTFIYDQTTFRDIMSIQYQNKEYHLALKTFTSPFDIVTYDYSVFECASLGKTCSIIKYVYLMSDNTGSDHLIVSDNRLILDRGFEQIQILPAVN